MPGLSWVVLSCSFLRGRRSHNARVALSVEWKRRASLLPLVVHRRARRALDGLLMGSRWRALEWRGGGLSLSRAFVAELPVRGGGLLASRALLADRDRARLGVWLALFLSSREDHGLTQKRAHVRLKSAFKVQTRLGCPHVCAC